MPLRYTHTGRRVREKERDWKRNTMLYYYIDQTLMLSMSSQFSRRGPNFPQSFWKMRIDLNL